MPDPTTHATMVASSSASIAAGTFLGVTYTVFGIALLGASIALIYLEEMNLKKMGLSILGSFTLGVVVAEFFAKAIALTIVHFAPWLNKLIDENNPAEIKIMLAFSVAFVAQKAIPVVFDWLDSKRKGNL